MINRELIEVFSEIAREKNVDRAELGTILEQLFLYLIEKQQGDSSNCSVIVNIDKGEIEIYAEKTIVDQVIDPNLEISLDEVVKRDPTLADMEIGETYVEVVEPEVFGRRMIAHAKQFFSQKIRDIERRYIYEDYAQRIGEIVIGTVQQVQRDNVFVNIEHAELRMPRVEQIASERYRRGETIRAVIKAVEDTPKGPDIIISRSDDHFLYKLFEMEVPEIEDGLIDIKAISRYPGERAKIIVQSHDRRIDAVGACVGMRGSRIQSVVRALNNEKIDIVNFSEKSEVLITRALSPAKPENLYIDDDRKYCLAIFDDDDLEFAIGRNGMNINLASRLTGFKIDIYGRAEYEKQQRDHATELSDVPDAETRLVNLLSKLDIITIGDLTGANEEELVKERGITEQGLEKLFDAIQAYIESTAVDEDAADEEEEEFFVEQTGSDDEPSGDTEAGSEEKIEESETAGVAEKE